MDDTTSMYYFFSTLAQVLAAFIALGSVFPTFRLPRISRMIRRRVKRYIDEIQKIDKEMGLKKDLTVFKYKGPLEQARFSISRVDLAKSIFEQNKNLPNIISDESRKNLEATEAQLRPLLSFQIKLIRSFKFALIFGAFVILIALLIIQGIPELICVRKYLFIGGIFGGIISIILMIRAIFLSLSVLDNQ